MSHADRFRPIGSHQYMLDNQRSTPTCSGIKTELLAFITTIVWFKMRICRADIVADVKSFDFLFFMNLVHLPSTNATNFLDFHMLDSILFVQVLCFFNRWRFTLKLSFVIQFHSYKNLAILHFGYNSLIV